MSSYLLSVLKENTIPPSEFRSGKGILSQTLGEQSPYSGIVWSMGILHLGFEKEYQYFSLLRIEECTIPVQRGGTKYKNYFLPFQDDPTLMNIF